MRLYFLSVILFLDDSLELKNLNIFFLSAKSKYNFFIFSLRRLLLISGGYSPSIIYVVEHLNIIQLSSTVSENKDRNNRKNNFKLPLITLLYFSPLS